jgi:hypothetical protein
LTCTNDNITLEGEVVHGVTESVSIVAVIGDDYSRLWVLGSFAEGTRFIRTAELASLGIEAELQAVRWYGIDQNGAVSVLELPATVPFSKSLHFSGGRSSISILMFLLFLPMP